VNLAQNEVVGSSREKCELKYVMPIMQNKKAGPLLTLPEVKRNYFAELLP
jgi:hypothetical protein